MSDNATTSDAHPEGETGAPGRRSILKGLAIAGVTVPFAAACGSSSDSSTSADKTPGGGGGQSSSTSTSSQTSEPPTTKAPGGNADVLTKSAAVPVGGGVILASAATVVTQPEKGTFEGFSSTCTHLGCTVATVSNGTINCACHGSMYSIKTGKVVGGPAPRPLPKKLVKVDGADIVAG